MDSAAFGYSGANPETDATKTIGDISKMFVAFDIWPQTSCMSGTPTTKYAAVVDNGTVGDGVGAATSTYTSTSEATYCVVARLVANITGGVPNTRYTAPNAQMSTINFYTNTGQFVTGGGWIDDPSRTRGNFGMNARFTKPGVAQGQLVYVYRGVYGRRPGGLRHQEQIVDALSFTGTTWPLRPMLQGNATIQINRSKDGVQLYSEGNASFVASLVDSGASSATGSDSFALDVTTSAGVLYTSVSTQLSKGGNVVCPPEVSAAETASSTGARRGTQPRQDRDGRGADHEALDASADPCSHRRSLTKGEDVT